MKTNAAFIVLLLSLLSLTALSQDLTNEPPKKWTIGVTLNSVEPITEAGYDVYFGQTRLFADLDHQKSSLTSYGITFSYKKQSDWGIRLQTKLTKYKVNETYDQRDFVSSGPPSGSYLIDTATVQQSSLVLSPGIFWNYAFKKLTFFGGFQAVYKKFGPAKEHSVFRDYDSQTNALLSHKYYDFELEGGYSLGIAPFVGFSAEIFKNILIGGEFSSAFSYYKLGGKFDWKLTYVHPNQIVDYASFQHTYEAFKFSSLITSISLAYSF
jgi:hypothetical protein